MECTVDQDIFHGPLDLLLFLIKRDELDIYDIPIARMAVVEALGANPSGQASAIRPMATVTSARLPTELASVAESLRAMCPALPIPLTLGA